MPQISKRTPQQCKCDLAPLLILVRGYSLCQPGAADQLVGTAGPADGGWMKHLESFRPAHFNTGQASTASKSAATAAASASYVRDARQ